MQRDGPSRRERRNRTLLVVVSGLVALALLGAWTVVLRRGPIEDDLTARAAAALDAAGITPSGLSFEGRDGVVSVPVEEMAAAGRVLAPLEGLRVIRIGQAVPPTTTTTTGAPQATTTTAAPTTTTTEAAPDASMTLTSSGAGVTISGTLAAADADELLTAAEGVFDQVADAITVNDATERPAWLAPLAQALPVMRFVADPGVAVDGDVLTVVGSIASEARRSEIIAAFAATGLEIADGLGIAAPPSQQEAAELQAALAAALDETVVLFETGSAEISEEGAVELTGLAELLIAVPGARVEVAGHTDSVGPDDANLALSLERAEAVRLLLIDSGVDPVQLTAAGYGETQPVADNSTPEGRAANRRIEFVVEGSE